MKDDEARVIYYDWQVDLSDKSRELFDNRVHFVIRHPQVVGMNVMVDREEKVRASTSGFAELANRNRGVIFNRILEKAGGPVDWTNWNGKITEPGG